MKKLLLILVFAASVFAVSAQDEAPAQAETITTDEATGVVTIVDNLVVAGEAGMIPNSKTTATAPTAKWKVADNAEVEYISYRSTYVKATDTSEGYYQTTLSDGSYFEFILPGYDCSKVTIASYKSGNGGKYYCYAGNASEPFYTIDVTKEAGNSTGNIEVEIPEEYRAAGTVYRIQTAYVADPEQYRARLQMQSITYTCTPKEVVEAKWAAPVCNIENGSYLLAGQVIKFTCEEGGTVTGDVSYKTSDNVSHTAQLENGEFVVPQGMSNNANIKIVAKVTGAGKNASESVTMLFKYTNGTNIMLLNYTFSDFKTTKVLGEAEFYYNLSVLNWVEANTTLTIKAELYSHEEEPRLYKTEELVLRPEVTAAALADGEVSPVLPTTLTGAVKMDGVATGGFYAKMSVKIGATGKYQNMSTESGNEMREVRVEGTTSGVEDIELEAAEAVYYNLSGVRVEPAKGMGVLIRVCGGNASKVVF